MISEAQERQLDAGHEGRDLLNFGCTMRRSEANPIRNARGAVKCFFARRIQETVYFFFQLLGDRFLPEQRSSSV
jgi:hypothetical protein